MGALGAGSIVGSAVVVGATGSREGKGYTKLRQTL